MSRKTWIKTYKLIVLFYRFQSIIDSSHKSFIHNHFVSRLVFLSKRICSKAEREREREKKSFILSVFFTILPVAISLEALTLSLLLLLFEKKKRRHWWWWRREREEEKWEEEEEAHSQRPVWLFCHVSLNVVCIGSFTATKNARNISYFS
jgi:hypothetical protein